MNWIPYYGVCALLWFVVWTVGFWYFRSRQQHGPLWKRMSWPRRVSLIVAIALIPVCYLASELFYQRLIAAFPEQRSWLAPMADLYVPAQFLKLLLAGSWDRSYEPFLYPIALAAVVLIPFLIHRFVVALRVRNPRVVGFLLVGLVALTCFVFMLGPV